VVVMAVVHTEAEAHPAVVAAPKPKNL